MKRLIIIAIVFLLLPIHTNLNAVNTNHKKGYTANIEVGGTFIDNFGFRPEILTSHGYSFGNGLFVGAGVGIGLEPWKINDTKNRIFIPIFADLKYSFIDKFVSPFVNLKAGTMIGCTGIGLGYVIMPSIGIDIWRFSISIGYQNYSCTYEIPMYKNNTDIARIKNSDIIGTSKGSFGGAGLKIGVSYTF